MITFQDLLRLSIGRQITRARNAWWRFVAHHYHISAQVEQWRSRYTKGEEALDCIANESYFLMRSALARARIMEV